MNKLFGLLLLALAFLPGGAEAAARFAVCSTTCTWDNTSTAMWSATSGGATGASAPTSADTVTLDANTCVGGTTCTITTFAGTISAQSITWGACTASTTGCIVDASVNNTSFALTPGGGQTGFFGSGTGTRKWLAGTGTYTITRSSSGNHFSMNTATNDQGSVFSGATWVLSGNTANAGSFLNPGFSIGPLTINGNPSGGSLGFNGTATYASITINSPNWITIPQSVTTTITGALTINGSSASSIVQLAAASYDTAQLATISIGSASSGTWAVLRAITTSGAAALTVSNCINGSGVTLANGGACNAPSAGGGGGGRIIGG